MILNEKYTEYFCVEEEGGKNYAERIFCSVLLLGYPWVMLCRKYKNSYSTKE